ncbi:DUF1707 domain-containing protein [Actinoplanes sp. NEAU-A12]|uniref:DUF1707 domain-containing protein n=1 Tax=Actinoplanes sandaracinus TaxID=3045177 RepID=A0ABT6X071_9ACTN|nr:DUF1707 domain-containing protein [Actinoplanes sandaracinus]MDI6105405.1 DUF1707 domain-containing protein [Actinoplanes sandaracinus]
MTAADDDHESPANHADLRIGTPERASAEDALETHFVAKRLASADYERRMAACRSAHTRSELMKIFADLPVPHPELPAAVMPVAMEAANEGPPMPMSFFAGCLTLGLGLPVAVVLGFVYGMWWALAVPVALTVVMAYVEHLRTPRDSQADNPRGG